jgi:formiminotetrahydrofolate cyclodeaminase
VDDQDEALQPGAIEAKVRGDVDALVSTHPMGESLAEMAFKLARTLDSVDVKELAMAGINKELRETLCELARLAEGDDDDLAAALSVPTSLRNSSES